MVQLCAKVPKEMDGEMEVKDPQVMLLGYAVIRSKGRRRGRFQNA